MECLHMNEESCQNNFIGQTPQVTYIHLEGAELLLKVLYQFQLELYVLDLSDGLLLSLVQLIRSILLQRHQLVL